jgi:hypothetical protein
LVKGWHNHLRQVFGFERHDLPGATARRIRRHRPGRTLYRAPPRTALAQAGAAVFTTRTSQETVAEMRRLQPRIVVIDSAADPDGAIAVWAQANPDWPCSVIHYVDERVEPMLGRKVLRTEPVSAVLDAVLALVRGER